MKIGNNRLGIALLIVALSSAGCDKVNQEPVPAKTQNPAAATPTAPAARQNPASRVDEICGIFNQSVENWDDLLDKSSNGQDRPRNIAIARKFLDDLKSVEHPSEKDLKTIRLMNYEMLAVLAANGDDEAQRELQKQADGKADFASMAPAMGANLVVQWSQSPDPAVQSHCLKIFDQLLRVNSDDLLCEFLAAMARHNATSGELSQDAWHILETASLKLASAYAILQERRVEQRVLSQPALLSQVDGTAFDGSRIDPARLKGKVVVLFFWASWCGPCHSQIDRLVKMYPQLHDKGLEVVGIPVGTSPADLQFVVRQYPAMTWPQLNNGQITEAKQFTSLFNVATVPTLLIFDRAGKIRRVAVHRGYESLVKDLLSENETQLGLN